MKTIVFSRFFAIFTFCVIWQKIFKNVPKMLPESFQDSPKPVQDPPKTFANGPKAPQKWPLGASKTPWDVQDAPKARLRRAQDASKLAKTPQESPKTLPRPLQSSIFDCLGTPKMQFFAAFPNYLPIQASHSLTFQI